MKISYQKEQLNWFNVGLLLLITLLGSLGLLMLWAWLLADGWLQIDFQNELPNALMLAVVSAGLLVAVTYLPQGSAKKLIVAGFALIVLEILLELPLKKYVAVYPHQAASIVSWFFLFGLAQFIGLLNIFRGLVRLSRSKSLSKNSLEDSSQPDSKNKKGVTHDVPGF